MGPVKRTARYEILTLNLGKRHAAERLARAYARDKDRALVVLGRPAHWRFLDRRRAFRTFMKASGSDLPVRRTTKPRSTRWTPYAVTSSPPRAPRPS